MNESDSRFRIKTQIEPNAWHVTDHDGNLIMRITNPLAAVPIASVSGTHSMSLIRAAISAVDREAAFALRLRAKIADKRAREAEALTPTQETSECRAMASVTT